MSPYTQPAAGCVLSLAGGEGNRVICRICGFHNGPRDEFCASCGKYLDWGEPTADVSSEPTTWRASSGQPDSPTTSQPDSPTISQPVPPAPPIAPTPDFNHARPITHTQPISGTHPAWADREPDRICWSCGRRNPADHASCLQCGRKLTAGTVAGGGSSGGVGRGRDAGSGATGGRRMLAVGAGIVAVLVMGGVGVAAFLGGGPGPTATPFAGGLGSPSPSSGPSASGQPSAEPSASAEASLGPSTGASGLPSPSSAPLSPSPSAATTAGPTTAPTPTAAPATPEPPQIVRFRRESFSTGTRKLVDCTDAAFDNTIELGWELRAATGAELSIDGGGLYDSYSGTNGAVTVPFSCGEASHTYKLTTTGGTGKPASMTRTIGRATPRIVSWSLVADPACSGDTGTTPVYISWEIEIGRAHV